MVFLEGRNQRGHTNAQRNLASQGKYNDLNDYRKALIPLTIFHSESGHLRYKW